MTPYTLHLGDCLEYLKTLPENSVDSLVTDPPAGISFMGKAWDSDMGGRKDWICWLERVMREAMRVMKPGAHGLVWALPRTSHWTATALEYAGFEIRDCVTHLFGSGFPKSHNVSKAIDRKLGAEPHVVGYKNQGVRSMFDGGKPRPATLPATQWHDWGTALKPSSEMWWLVRKPLSENGVAENVLKWGTGAINIGSSRIGSSGGTRREGNASEPNDAGWENMRGHGIAELNAGRWPANTVLSHNPDCVLRAEGKRAEGKRATTDFSGKERERDGAVTYSNDEPDIYDCTEGCAVAELDRQSGRVVGVVGVVGAKNIGDRTFYHPGIKDTGSKVVGGRRDVGGASRFFYTSKPSTHERDFGVQTDKKFAATMGNGIGAREHDPNDPNDPNAYRRNAHPTVKPFKLMGWLVTLITPPGGTVLDPFMGSGTTGAVAIARGFRFIGCEKDPESHATALARIQSVRLAPAAEEPEPAP